LAILRAPTLAIGLAKTRYRGRPVGRTLSATFPRLTDLGPMCSVGRPSDTYSYTLSEEVIGLRARFSKFRALLYTGATLATFLLAAGAKWKNN
jgi:hypothetical protein